MPSVIAKHIYVTSSPRKKANDFNLYYLVGLVAGVFTAACIEITLLSIVIGAVVGLLFTALFVNVLVKGRVDA